MSSNKIEQLAHLKIDPKEKKNLINNPKFKDKIKEMKAVWKEKILFARGEGKAQILRYTSDSKAEQGTISMPK